MILNNALNAGNFVYCMIHWSPHEEIEYFNDGDGHYHPSVYVLEGSGWAEFKTPEGDIYISEATGTPGTIVDTSHSKGNYQIIRTTDSGLTLFHINPVPATRNLHTEIVNGPITRTITADAKRVVVVVITGPITANGKQLTSLQHSKIFPGKSVELIIPEHAICALVTEIN